jgi:cytochrome c
MDNMEFNKIFAAFLVAGIIAALAGFTAKKLVHPHELEENAVKIEGVEIAGSGAAPVIRRAEPILAMIADADIARGEKLSRACAACHSFNQGGPHGTGPNLWNKVNANVGAREGYSYSDAMAEHGGQWTHLSLNKYLWKPKVYMPGTKMNYIGLRKPEDRAAMIAWLRTLSDSPVPLPTQNEIELEIAELAPETLAIVEPEISLEAGEVVGDDGGENSDAIADDLAEENDQTVSE